MTNRISLLRTAKLTPAERAAAVAAFLAVGLLPHLHPATFPPRARLANSQGKPVEST